MDRAEPVSVFLHVALVLGAIAFGRAPAEAAGRLEDYSRDVFSIVNGSRRLNVDVVKPPGYPNPSTKLPLTVFLHGSTDGRSSKRARLNDTVSGLLLATQGDNWERRQPCRLGCTPEALESWEQAIAMQDEAFASFLLVPQIPETSTATGWSGNFDLLFNLIEQTRQQYNVDANRIYLTGFSDGGFATYSMLNLRPDDFAAGVPIAGGGTTTIAPRIKDVPMWIFHGAADTVVSPTSATSMFNALTAAGGSPRLTIYPGVGHDSFAPALFDLTNEFYPWLFAQPILPEPCGAVILITALTLAAARARLPRGRK
jgi:predicted peptidase